MRPRQLRGQGIVLLNVRRRYFQGHAPKHSADRAGLRYWSGSHEDWQVLRHAPKQDIWGHSQHARARRAHLIAYQMVATHKSGLVVTLTSWACGASTTVDFSLEDNVWPRCKNCEQVAKRRSC